MNLITITVDPELGSGKAPYVSTDVHYHADDADTLACLQSIVGGYVDRLEIDDDGTTVWFNDEGKLAGLPFNPLADRLVRHVGLQPGDHLVGNVVITGFDPDTGDTIGLTDAKRAELVKRLVDETADLVRFRQAVFQPAVEQPAVDATAEPEVRRRDRTIGFVWDVGLEGYEPGYTDHEPLGTVQAVLSVTHNGREDYPAYSYTGTLSRRIASADRRTWRTTINMSRTRDPHDPLRLLHIPGVQRFSEKGLQEAADAALESLRRLTEDDDVRPFFTAPRVPADELAAA